MPSIMPNQSRKRPRADSDTQSVAGEPVKESKEGFTKDDAFWYPDGSIVLLAGNIGFKVYQGLLAEQSEVFADLFTIPQPPEVPSIEECPTVHLSDTAQELRALLSVMIHGRKYTHNDGAHLEDIVAWARMSHKYHIQDLLDDALKRLRRFFPPRFVEMNSSDHPVQPLHAIAVVNLARLTEKKYFIPSALYYCCMLNAHTLLHGSSRSDGTVDRLSDDDLERCIHGKAVLAGQLALSRSSILCPLASEACATPDKCAFAIILLHVKLAGGSRGAGATDALESWRKDIDRGLGVVREQSYVCTTCVMMLYKREILERKKVWLKLPSIFNFTMRNWERSAA
ncbi:uncharacterized protein C8Q71DRAFT_765904 [Rhodofomes roseus]|uniref:BTB domain-containing protein n=1 Tax=Rhodofomes roseus TaxID=34475 RepID=A0ABQ8KE63_9APHY|nr:uncharacterized protein C8Q71DRAFT_765904 [Rhodofomes roseus]KAH9835443.1 hypothetical protein C8Q71DRAFT_765904 [Rhodofomes roseus]